MPNAASLQQCLALSLERGPVLKFSSGHLQEMTGPLGAIAHVSSEQPAGIFANLGVLVQVVHEQSLQFGQIDALTLESEVIQRIERIFPHMLPLV